MTTKETAWEPLAAQLRSPKSAERRTAAKKLRKLGRAEAGPQLLEALAEELKDERTWETQYQMIMALGESGHLEALPLLEALSRKDFEHTMVLMAVGDALVRLSIPSGDHARRTEGLLQPAVHPMLLEGALRALAMTRTTVPEPLGLRLAQHVDALGPGERADWCRTWVAAAAAGWRHPGLRPYLERWTGAEFSQLQSAAQAALEGRHLKWSPL